MQTRDKNNLKVLLRYHDTSFLFPNRNEETLLRNFKFFIRIARAFSVRFHQDVHIRSHHQETELTWKKN